MLCLASLSIKILSEIWLVINDKACFSTLPLIGPFSALNWLKLDFEVNLKQLFESNLDFNRPIKD